ncbi:MAG: hypothetical protein KF866_09105 [Phycisphaeraceae bacterium]|nr:hypothetical protein [Phycisphaeraceae bacterium]
MADDKSKSNGAVSLLALILSVVATGIALYVLLANRSSNTKEESNDYQRVVQDIWGTLEPVYQDYGLDVSGNPPSTIQEALAPLVRTFTVLGPKDAKQGP